MFFSTSGSLVAKIKSNLFKHRCEYVFKTFQYLCLVIQGQHRSSFEQPAHYPVNSNQPYT